MVVVEVVVSAEVVVVVMAVAAVSVGFGSSAVFVSETSTAVSVTMFCASVTGRTRGLEMNSSSILAGSPAEAMDSHFLVSMARILSALTR